MKLAVVTLVREVKSHYVAKSQVYKVKYHDIIAVFNFSLKFEVVSPK